MITRICDLCENDVAPETEPFETPSGDKDLCCECVRNCFRNLLGMILTPDKWRVFGPVKLVIPMSGKFEQPIGSIHQTTKSIVLGLLNSGDCLSLREMMEKTGLEKGALSQCVYTTIRYQLERVGESPIRFRLKKPPEQVINPELLK